MIYKKRWVNGIRILCNQVVKKHEKGRKTRGIPVISSLFPEFKSNFMGSISRTYPPKKKSIIFEAFEEFLL